MVLDKRKWEPCVTHEGDDVLTFIQNFFAKERRVLLIAGAGFDPRSTIIAEHLSKQLINHSPTVVFFREERPDPPAKLVSAANAHSEKINQLFNTVHIFSIDVFSKDDEAVVGGINAVSKISQFDIIGFTDIIIDISALSIGVSFPIIRYIYDNIVKYREMINVHIFVTHSPSLDLDIVPFFCERADYIRGFAGTIQLDSAQKARKLWLPQLSLSKYAALIRIFSKVRPDETCPIIPWPSQDPKLPDRLLERYYDELLSAWEVDPRDIVFASENDPLDLYCTILDLDDFRRKVLSEVGGSFLVLSPTGSKLMALGSLLAALERDLPVAYLETMGHTYSMEVIDFSEDSPYSLFHLWLVGSEAYPPNL